MGNLAGFTLGYSLGHPSATAQVRRTADGWSPILHQDLLNRVASLAAWLLRQGIEDGDRVALLAHTSPEWMWADLAILAIGAVVVPIYPSLPAQQVTEVLLDSETRFIIVADEEQEAKLTPGFRRLVMNFPRWQQAVTLAPPIAPEEFIELAEQVEESHLATLVYTSGTTAHSRGVMLTHGNLLSNIRSLLLQQRRARDVHVDHHDRALSVLPLAHIFERMVHHSFMGRGVPIYYTSPDRLAEDIREAKPTVMVSVPRIYERAFAAIDRAANGPLSRPLFHASVPVARRRADRLQAGNAVRPAERLTEAFFDVLVYRRIRAALGGSLRFAYSGGAPLHPDLARFFLGAGVPVLEGYGLTETSPVLTVNTVKTLKIGTVGRPIPDVRVKIADDGEVLAEGPNIMVGYWNRPEETAAVLRDGWFYTGDIGEMLPSGHLRIVDRKRALMVLSTGKNVVPLTITQALESSPWIEQAMLLGDGRKYVAALIVPDWEAMSAWAIASGLNPEDKAALLKEPRVTQLLGREIAERTSSFAPWEQPKRWVLLTEPFTEANGELTPTLKVKARVVEEHYRPLIHDLYPDDEPFPQR